MSGALSTVTGITSLFNDESKELQELMVKVQRNYGRYYWNSTDPKIPC